MSLSHDDTTKSYKPGSSRATNRSRHYQFLQEPPPRPPPASAPCSEALRGAAQIAALRKRKEERSARWSGKRLAPESSIFELQRSIRRLEQEIANLASITVAEAAVEARKNSWGAWLSSLVYKLVEESEDEKARKERARQEKRIEKDLKERRLGSQQAQLQEEQSLLRKAKDNIDAADLRDDQSIRAVEARTREREAREWLERERVERETAKVERERLAKVWKQQQQQREKEAQEAREALRKQQAEARAGELARQVKLRRRQKALVDELERLQRSHVHSNYDYSSTRQASATACSHDGWWEKVHGRTACPECYDVWTYLLQCPSCATKACPKCQSDLRPRFPNNTARARRTEIPRPRSPDPWDCYDDYN